MKERKRESEQHRDRESERNTEKERVKERKRESEQHREGDSLREREEQSRQGEGDFQFLPSPKSVECRGVSVMGSNSRVITIRLSAPGW